MLCPSPLLCLQQSRSGKHTLSAVELLGDSHGCVHTHECTQVPCWEWGGPSGRNRRVTEEAAFREGRGHGLEGERRQTSKLTLKGRAGQCRPDPRAVNDRRDRLVHFPRGHPTISAWAGLQRTRGSGAWEAGPSRPSPSRWPQPTCALSWREGSLSLGQCPHVSEPRFPW